MIEHWCFGVGDALAAGTRNEKFAIVGITRQSTLVNRVLQKCPQPTHLGIIARSRNHTFAILGTTRLSESWIQVFSEDSYRALLGRFLRSGSRKSTRLGITRLSKFWIQVLANYPEHAHLGRPSRSKLSQVHGSGHYSSVQIRIPSYSQTFQPGISRVFSQTKIRRSTGLGITRLFKIPVEVIGSASRESPGPIVQFTIANLATLAEL